MVKTKKWRRVLIFLFVALLATSIILAGCSSNKTKGVQGNTIKIGVNYELSGNVATYGTSCKNGVLLALDEANKNGGVLGKKIEYIVRDNKSDTGESTNVATQLVSSGIVALIGPATTGGVMAEEPVATNSKVSILATSATAPQVTLNPKTNKVRDYVFRVCIIDPDQALTMADFVNNNLKLKTGAIMMDSTNDYSKGLAKDFSEFFKSKGGKIVGQEGFISTDTDFKGQLTRLAANKPDFIYVPAYYNQVGMIIKQARDLGINVPFLGADGWDSPELVNLAGAPALENTYFTNHYSSSDQTPAVQDFVKAYQAKYKVVPDSFAALGYDTGKLLVATIKKANSADPKDIQKALANVKDYQGITGKLTFDQNHNPIKQVSIIKIVGGKQKLVTKIAPRTK